MNKTACNKDHECDLDLLFKKDGDCSYLDPREGDHDGSFCHYLKWDKHCKNTCAWPENQPKEDKYAPIRKLTKEQREEIFKFAMERSKQILNGEDDD